MKRNVKIRNILIDFGNHYVEATNGKRLTMGVYTKQIDQVIEEERLEAQLHVLVDVVNFIKETDLTRKEIVRILNDKTKNLCTSTL